MPSATKVDPNCGSPQQLVFVGTTRLRGYHETDGRYISTPDEANEELIIDVIAAPGWAGVVFQDLTLDLKLEDPLDADFVVHGSQNNYERRDWNNATAPGATRQLRIYMANAVATSGPGNGQTFYVGIRNPSSAPLKFTAVARCTYVGTATGCVMSFNDMTEGASLPGYHG